MDRSGRTQILYVTGGEPYAPNVAEGLRTEPAYTVVTATTAAQAREYLAENPDIQCLLCAESLSECDAFSFIESIRQAYPDLPIVCYPAEGSESAAANAISANATEYLPHAEDPGHIPELAATIREAIDESWPIVTLRERLKELRGIREVAHLLEDPISRPLAETLGGVVEAIPESFQYPSATEARLTVGETSVETDGFVETDWTLTEGTTTANGTDVTLRVSYLEEKPRADEGPFLSEERAFCRTIVTLVKGGIERRRYVEEITKSETLFRELAENLTEVLWVSDPSSEEMLYVNPEYEHVWGRSRQSLYDDPLSFVEAVHPDDRERVESALEAKANGRYEVEYRIAQPNGTIRWIYDRGIPVFDEDAELYRFVGLAEDVTERRVRKQQLAVLHRVLRHNLRNDLTVIAGYAELIAAITDGEALEYAETIHATSERLIQLAEKQQRIAAQLESTPRSVVVELSTVLRRVTETVTERFPNADIGLEIDAEASVGVPPRIELALLELLTNAVEHTETERPRVDVTIEATGGEVAIRISDTGPGIPQMEIDVLGTEEEPLFHGRGIGLWIAYWTVTHLGGSLDFEENSPDGSVVTVRVPQRSETDEV